jgi:hypothetical protein
MHHHDALPRHHVSCRTTRRCPHALSRALVRAFMLVALKFHVVPLNNNAKIHEAWPSNLQRITRGSKVHCHFTFSVPPIPRHATDIGFLLIIIWAFASLLVIDGHVLVASMSPESWHVLLLEYIKGDARSGDNPPYR